MFRLIFILLFLFNFNHPNAHEIKNSAAHCNEIAETSKNKWSLGKSTYEFLQKKFNSKFCREVNAIEFFNLRINQSIQEHNNVIAISPFVGKKALKGPSVQNFIDMGYKPDIQGLKNYYKNRVNNFFVHHGDSDGSSNVFEDQIVFKNENDAKYLAERIMQNG